MSDISERNECFYWDVNDRKTRNSAGDYDTAGFLVLCVGAPGGVRF